MTTSLSPRTDRPVDPKIVSVIAEIHKSSAELGFQLLLVGATARIILLENVFGLNAGRATTDVDFAFALNSWNEFHAIKKHLVLNANFEESKGAAQRLYLRLPGFEHRFTVDLIPYGGIENTPNSIAWPPDMSFIMNVAGYSDAMAASVSVEISLGLIIQVASIPGITILKLFAWADRGTENPKDAIDLTSLLKGYYDAGNHERVYEDAIEVLADVEFDPVLACAWLLGTDAAAISSPETKAKLIDLLEGKQRTRLVEDMARASRGDENAIEQTSKLLEQFTKGFSV